MRLTATLPLFLLAVPMAMAQPAPTGGGQSQVQPPPRPLTAEERVELLERRIDVLNDILMRLDQLQQEVQQLRGDVELQNNNLEGLQKRQRELYLDVDRRLSQMAGPKSGAAMPAEGMSSMGESPVAMPGVAEAAPSEPASAQEAAQAPAIDPGQTAGPAPIVPFTAPPSVTQPPADPALEQQVYQHAFDLLMQRRYDESKQEFQQFLAQYPNGRLTANAQYWLAEASYVTRDFPVALAEFAKVIERFPDSAKVSDALLKTGYIQYEQQEWAKARETLQGIVDNYPTSTAARLAEKRLERMRAEGR